jgi:serine protease Do
VIFSQSGGYQGIGFAVSSNLARKIFNDLRQYREVRRGWMGYMRLMVVTTQLAEQLNVPETKGALVAQMESRSPAYQAGIEPGDVIVAFNGTEITDPGHLERLMSDAPIGSTATVTLIRDGRRREVRVPIERRTA